MDYRITRGYPLTSNQQLVTSDYLTHRRLAYYPAPPSAGAALMPPMARGEGWTRGYATRFTSWFDVAGREMP